jgi:hypothetical protein
MDVKSATEAFGAGGSREDTSPDPSSVRPAAINDASEPAPSIRTTAKAISAR